MTTVNSVFSRSGFEAAVSLLIAGGQLIGYAARAAARKCRLWLHRAAGWARTSIQSASESSVVQQWAARISGWAKNPWVAGSAVAVIVAAIVFAAWLGLKPASTEPEAHVHDLGTSLVTQTVQSATLTQDDIDQVLTSLYVVLGQDGSIRVHGMPAHLSDNVRDDIARIAALAANRHLNRLVRRGRPLTTRDLSSINIAARQAVGRHFDHFERAA